MILFDTSAWIGLMRAGGQAFLDALAEKDVFTHDCVIGELALGSLPQRGVALLRLNELSRLPHASHTEIRRLIEIHTLWGRGIGYVDVHLLASLRLSPGVGLLTSDTRLTAVAADLNIAAQIAP
ncbi:MAG: PIN domain-containing protein [Pseudomonadota bacterium]